MSSTYNLTMNYSSLSDFARDVSLNLPETFVIILFFEYFLILLMGATGSKRFSGMTNIPQWAAVAGLVTATTSFLFYIVDGLITIEIVGFFIALAMISVLFYFLNQED